ncbi:MAG TPA: TfoX/Sxy family protein, partial [Rubrivivax sp.]|nr:TfoX/Sxy family protein [Rubrivivax sp.]
MQSKGLDNDRAGRRPGCSASARLTLMAGSKEFVVHILDRLQPLGAVTARAMFGGHGIYCDGVMFALIAEDVLYFKVDDQNRPRFEALGAGPFRPYADRPVTMSYYEVPA